MGDPVRRARQIRDAYATSTARVSLNRLGWRATARVVAWETVLSGPMRSYPVREVHCSPRLWGD